MSTTVVYLIKVLWQSANILYLLGLKSSSNYLILQNPPAVPSIPICWLYCFIANVKFVIDWHNYAYSIMALGSGPDNFLVILAKIIETRFGTRASFNFCVTKAMQENLQNKWKIRYFFIFMLSQTNIEKILLLWSINKLW